MKLLCVLNCCGIRGLERVDLYVKHLQSLLAQDFDDFRVVVSGACSTRACKQVLNKHLGNRVSYNWTRRKLTVNICYNQTVRVCERYFGPFDAHVYLDSGIDVAPYPTMLRDMHDRMTQQRCAMVAARVSTDSGYEWAGIEPGNDGEFLMPVGKACNLHCQAFHRSLWDAYGDSLPDIFIGDTTESVLSFLCAGVNRRWLILGKPEVFHEHSMDGPSSGHERGCWNNPSKALLFPELGNVITLATKGQEYGLGYEECQSWVNHRPEKFTKDGNAKDERLVPFIRDNLFIGSRKLKMRDGVEFCYADMESEFVP